MKFTDWGYLAGLEDGDGSFFIGFEIGRSGNPRFCPVINLSLHGGTYHILKEINEELNNTRKVTYYDRNEGQSPRAVLGVTRKELVRDILINLIPHLRIKREKAKLLLQAIEIMDKATPPLPRTREDILKLAELRDRMSALSFGNKGKHNKKWTYEAIKNYIDEHGYGTKERYKNIRKQVGIKTGFKKGNKPWNKKYPDQMVKKAIKLRKQGVGPTEIARKLNVPIGAVSNWIYK